MDAFVLCGFCVSCIYLCEFYVKRQRFFFSPNDYERNNKLIYKYFQYLKRWKYYIALFVARIENLKTQNLIPLEKTLVPSIICSKCKNEEILKEEESTDTLKILGLINNIKEYHKIWNHELRT